MAFNGYTYSEKAKQDVKQIFRYTYQNWGLSQAENYDAGLESTLINLSKHPEIGRPCHEILPGYMRFEYEKHIIFYKQRKNDLFILRILHQSMDVQIQLKK